MGIGTPVGGIMVLVVMALVLVMVLPLLLVLLLPPLATLRIDLRSSVYK
jgi:hypothetical protein